MKQSKHFLSYCQLCKVKMVICFACGNNCCNGGSGKNPDGSKCQSCLEAYDDQDLYYNNELSVVFADYPNSRKNNSKN